MKRALLWSMACMLSLSALAQASSEHLKFMGIPIDGNCYQLAQKLVQKGFKMRTLDGEVAKPTSNFIKLEGAFAGVANTEVYVVGSRKAKTAWKVVVLFPEENNWNGIKRQYNRFKDSYIDKYGRPTSDYHFFSKPYYEGDGYEMQAVRLEKCHYAAFWDNGIWMEITKYEQVRIAYEDKINSDLAEREREEIVNDDI